MKKIMLTVTTNGSGAGSASSRSVLGKLFAIEYRPGTIDTGATLTVTVEDGALSRTVLSKASAGTSNILFYPRAVMNLASDGSALTGTAGYDLCQPLIAGQVKMTIASGAATKTGSVVVFYED